MKSWFYRLLKLKLFFIVCLVIFIFLAISFGQEFSRRYYLQQQIKSLESQITELENKNHEFGELIEYFETQNFTEEEARLKMGFKKFGEEVIVINQPKVRAGAVEPNDDLAMLSNPIKWWHFFLKKS